MPIPLLLHPAHSPDLTKWAFTMVEGFTGGRAGWIDGDGKFTAASPTVSVGPFGGNPPLFESVGFDGAGNFYYRSKPEQGAGEMFKLPAGSTGNAQKIDASADAGIPSLNYDGTMLFGCPQQSRWLGQNAVAVQVSGVQIGKAAVTGADERGCPVLGPPTGLLPDTNTAPVAQPVAAPDGSRIAFRYLGTDLYTVATDGTSPPAKVDLSSSAKEMLSRGVLFVGWI